MTSLPPRGLFPHIDAVEEGFVRGAPAAALALRELCASDEVARAGLLPLIGALDADPSGIDGAFHRWRAWLSTRRRSALGPDGGPPTEGEEPAPGTATAPVTPPPWAEAPIRPPEDRPVAELGTWALRLAREPTLARLAEALGRVQAVLRTDELLTPSPPRPWVYAGDPGGVVTGGPLSRALPAELAQLPRAGGSPGRDSAHLVRLLEQRLLCWDEAPPTASPPRPSGRRPGPAVILLDTSGSMAGEPEALAKAIVLALVTTLAAERRDARVLVFGSSRELVEHQNTTRDADLHALLRVSFGGGTDPEPALHRALDRIADTPETDLVIVSDGAFDLGAGARRRLETARNQGLSTHLVLVGTSGPIIDDPLWNRLNWRELGTLTRRLRPEPPPARSSGHATIR